MCVYVFSLPINCLHVVGLRWTDNVDKFLNLLLPADGKHEVNRDEILGTARNDQALCSSLLHLHICLRVSRYNSYSFYWHHYVGHIYKHTSPLSVSQAVVSSSNLLGTAESIRRKVTYTELCCTGGACSPRSMRVQPLLLLLLKTKKGAWRVRRFRL